MSLISSGSPRPRFTLTPRHEVQRLNGLAPPLPRAVVASFRGLGASGGYADPGFPVFPLVVYGILIGLMLGSGRRRG